MNDDMTPLDMCRYLNSLEGDEHGNVTLTIGAVRRIDKTLLCLQEKVYMCQQSMSRLLRENCKLMTELYPMDTDCEIDQWLSEGPDRNEEGDR